jgi:hypothetical protein
MKAIMIRLKKGASSAGFNSRGIIQRIADSDARSSKKLEWSSEESVARVH